MGNYSPEYKAEICRCIIDGGEKVSNVSAEQNLIENTVRSWLKSYEERDGKSFVKFTLYINFTAFNIHNMVRIYLVNIKF